MTDKELMGWAARKIRELREQNKRQDEQLSIVHTFRALILRGEPGWMEQDFLQDLEARAAGREERNPE